MPDKLKLFVRSAVQGKQLLIEVDRDAKMPEVLRIAATKLAISIEALNIIQPTLVDANTELQPYITLKVQGPGLLGGSSTAKPASEEILDHSANLNSSEQSPLNPLIDHSAIIFDTVKLHDAPEIKSNSVDDKRLIDEESKQSLDDAFTEDSAVKEACSRYFQQNEHIFNNVSAAERA